jgi:hypothetical protein
MKLLIDVPEDLAMKIEAAHSKLTSETLVSHIQNEFVEHKSTTGKITAALDEFGRKLRSLDILMDGYAGEGSSRGTNRADHEGN